MPPLVVVEAEQSHVTLAQEEPKSASGSLRRAAWIPTVAGAALLATGGIFYGLAKGTEGSLRSASTQIANEAEADRVVRVGRDYQTASFAFLGAGLVAAVTASAMFFFSTPADAPSVSVVVAPTGFAVGVGGALP